MNHSEPEFENLKKQHKAQIEAEELSREVLIDLLAGNLASYNILCRTYEEIHSCLEESVKLRTKACDILGQESAEMKRKYSSVLNAIPLAIEEGIKEGGRVLTSTAGKKGANNKNALTNELKAWALQEASAMRGADMEISHTLAKRVPKHLAEASDNPQRLIYDALRNRSKQSKNPKQARGFTPTSSRQP